VLAYRPELFRHARLLSFGVAGVLLFPVVSLAILEIAEIATCRARQDLPLRPRLLPSLARALSFLAVGAVLLLAGFFYQRISDQLDERDRRGSPAEPPGNVTA
jgi:hypothetical protein